QRRPPASRRLAGPPWRRITGPVRHDHAQLPQSSAAVAPSRHLEPGPGAMIYHVLHTTTYTYSEPVSLCHNIAHLTPRVCPRQSTRQSQLLITPLPAVTAQRLDYFGNPMTFFTIQEPHRRLTVTAMHQTQVLPS